ncbi:MAG: DAK2 domain-containing protein [Oscillospiraceae bacterium]|nr:DAK2 domain-containing protein [Oscillospiraceae bacterium]
MIDGAAFSAMIINAAANVQNHKEQINELNVFPVPDGDTGTNMSLTLGAAAAEMKAAPSGITLDKAATAAANALLCGARGNSGVITSLLFRGMAKSLKEQHLADGRDFARALAAGVDTAYKAVMKPAEGTILTVSRVSAEDAVIEAENDNNLEHILEFTLESAKRALAETVNQNPVLKKAGVVDAGGMGYVDILDGMLLSLRGVVIDVTEPDADVKSSADFSEFSTEDIQFGYCTEFIVKREHAKDPEKLRAFLATIGDSLVLVDGDDIIKVHVHTNNPGLALEEALTYGSFATVKVENMRLQHTEKVLSEAEERAAEKQYGIVSVCSGDGIRSVFADLGVDGFAQGGQTMNPSTDDILREINRTPAEIVLVLPNNKNIIMAAEQTIPMTKKKVIVVPTATICQGITALLNFDPEQALDANLDAMTEAIKAVSTIQVTYAARDSDFDGNEIHEGDYLALYNGALFGAGKDLPALLASIADRICADGKDYITIFAGQDISDSDAAAAADVFRTHCQDAEVSLIDGGQPVYYYLISAE